MFLDKLTTPWSGRRGARRFPHLAHEHAELRLALARLQQAAAQPGCPPIGHAFFGMALDAAAFLAVELPAHAAEEEAGLYPRLVLAPDELRGLQSEHAGLQLVAVEVAERLRGLGDRPDHAGWERVREAVGRLVEAVDAHLAHEEAVIDRCLGA